MQTRQLGNSDLHITRVGYGAWAIGGSGWQLAWGRKSKVTETVPALSSCYTLTPRPRNMEAWFTKNE